MHLQIAILDVVRRELGRSVRHNEKIPDRVSGKMPVKLPYMYLIRCLFLDKGVSLHCDTGRDITRVAP